MDPQTMNRKDYLDRAQETLRDWRAKIDQLKVRSNLAALEAEDATRKAVEALDDSYDGIQKKIAQLARSGESGWEKMRDDIEQAWHKLEEDFRQAGGAPR